VRLGEAIERQQVVLARLAETVTGSSRSLAPAVAEAGEAAGDGGAAEAAGEGGGVTAVVAAAAASPAFAAQIELDRLRQELARERELVERLRRSKLDVERRAAEAEARLGEGGAGPGRRGFLGKLLAREDESPR
jgi:hypothetical protein